MNNAFMYDVTPHVAEIYDQNETYSDDVHLIQQLSEGLGNLRILEPFCGTGRILIPLAVSGHRVMGLDKASGMLACAREKIQNLDKPAQSRISLLETDVTRESWPSEFDLVILGSNCLYELPTSEEQEKCIRNASSVLSSGGHIYVDNNHMEGGLDPSWQTLGIHPGFPTGICKDGTSMETFIETTWYDIPCRLAKFRRITRVKLSDGHVIEEEYFQQKHPVSTGEVQSWLKAHGFIIEHCFGDRQGNPYSSESSRAIFWARKR